MLVFFLLHTDGAVMSYSHAGGEQVFMWGPGVAERLLWSLKNYQEKQEVTGYPEQEPGPEVGQIKSSIGERNLYRREKNSQLRKHNPDGKIRFLKMAY